MKNYQIISVLLLIGMLFFLSNCKKDKKDDDQKTVTHAIGEKFGGGVVFYVYDNGQHGLIADTIDLQDANWGCYQTALSGPNDTTVGTGLANTNAIIAGCNESNIAAKICRNSTRNGYSDWFLPSMGELNLMIKNLFQTGICYFKQEYYWSSSQKNADNAWEIYACAGNIFYQDKSNIFHVRAVRAF